MMAAIAPGGVCRGSWSEESLQKIYLILFILTEEIRMTIFTMSVKDEQRGMEIHTTFDELSWEELWEALRLHDGNRPRRKGKKFYIFSSRTKEHVDPQM
jgi:hypothetical protein